MITRPTRYMAITLIPFEGKITDKLARLLIAEF